jgi:uncharacterized membrane protein YcgQ (UPF0703/DUF1980 family)
MLKFLLFIFPFSIVFYFLQSFLAINFIDEPLFYTEWSIHLFIFIATITVYYLVKLIVKIAPDKAGFTFLGLGLLKMFASIIFLFPLINSSYIDKVPTVIYFFITYFVYLLVETVFVTRLLNKK